MSSSLGFRLWLAQQVDRDDAIGDLARDIACERSGLTTYDPGSWHAHLSRLGADPAYAADLAGME